MEIREEDTSKVYVNDLPRQEEYADIIHRAQEAGRYADTDFYRASKASDEAWNKLMSLMGSCIARGMRLQQERSKTCK